MEDIHSFWVEYCGFVEGWHAARGESRPGFLGGEIPLGTDFPPISANSWLALWLHPT